MARSLIKKVFWADPLRCPNGPCEIRIVSLIDEKDVIERFLRHLWLWHQGGTQNDPGPNYTKPIMAFSTTGKSPAAPE